MDTGELKILLAIEPTWTVSFNGSEYLTLPSRDILLQDSTIQMGRWQRRIESIEWLRPNVVRLHGRQKLRSRLDVITLYPGDRLPSTPALRRQRQRFQTTIAGVLREHFKTRTIERQTLYSDKRYSIGGAYPRFLIGNRAAIAVDPDETSPVVNGIMRAALLWAPLVRRRIAVVVPSGRAATIVSRLRLMTDLQRAMEWLEFDGQRLQPLELTGVEPESHVHEYRDLQLDGEVRRICNQIPGLVAVPDIPQQAVSIRFRGIEVARVSPGGTSHPLGTPLESVTEELGRIRCHGSRHPMARAHEERWLESNLIAQAGDLIPAVDTRHVYPQVPSFVGEERNIIDLLAVTAAGRLIVMEIKASADPDLPFQALDYWIAVERHRKAGDFTARGYFQGCQLRDEPALLVLVAPLLTFHKTLKTLIGAIPGDVPILEAGLNENWKKEIKILRRQGLVS